MATKRLTLDEFRNRFLRDWERLDPDDRWGFAVDIHTGVTAVLVKNIRPPGSFIYQRNVQPNGLGELADMLDRLGCTSPISPMGLKKLVQDQMIEEAQPRLDAHAKLSTSKRNVEKIEASKRLKRSGLTIREIAERNRENHDTVRTRLYRANKAKKPAED